MDYKKEYEAMVQRASELHEGGNALTKQQMEIVCPKLAESEDERVNEEIRNFLIDMECKREWIAYLEKQKEQKPAEWSDSFEENIRNLLHDKLTWHSADESLSSAVFIDDKTLKDIISGIWFYVGKEALKYPNKELHLPEWSEEDEDKVDDICKLIEHATIIPRSGDDDTGIPPTRLNDKYKGELKAFVKSFRPYWKPSEEQMKALNTLLCTGDFSYVGQATKLQELYIELKKL